MDTPKPAHQPVHLLNDLESIRELLGEQSDEPPLLLDSLDLDNIPLLSDIVTPASQPSVAGAGTAPNLTESLRSTVQRSISRDSELNRLDTELRAAAQLILQDVIDDFVPQIEAELKHRLDAHLSRLLPPRKG